MPHMPHMPHMKSSPPSLLKRFFGLDCLVASDDAQLVDQERLPWCVDHIVADDVLIFVVGFFHFTLQSINYFYVFNRIPSSQEAGGCPKSGLEGERALNLNFKLTHGRKKLAEGHRGFFFV
jgi:hypothetical protein